MKTIKSLTEAKLSRLPEGWYWTKLEDIANFKNGINFNKSQRGDTGILTLDVFNMYSKNIFPKLEDLYRVNITPKEEYILKNGDILFVRSSVKREGIGWTTVFKEISEQVTFCGFIIRGRLVTSDVFPKYLAYYLRTASARKNIIDSSSQVTITNINQNSLGAIPVPLSPLPEQRAIVSKIEQLFSELDNGIANLKLAQEQLKVYRQAVLKKAFEGELTKKWREQQTDLSDAGELLERIRKEREEVAKDTGKKVKIIKPPTDAELVELPMMPKEWMWVKLDYLGDLGRGKSKHRPRNDKILFGGKYPFIQTGEVKAANHTIKSFEKTYSDVGLAQSKLWPKGTLCITIAANIAETAFLGFEGCFPDSIVGFTATERLVSKEYVYHFFKANQSKIESLAPATAQKNINLNILENLLIPLCSIPEQHAIVQEIETRLSVCDKIEQDIEMNLEKAEALRQSILKKAFEGKLLNERELAEVRGAEDWEPDEVLLERIKAERVGNEKK